MSENQSNEESKLAKIVFIGNDKTYLSNLEVKYRALCSSTDLTFEHYQAQSDSQIQSQIIRLHNEKPHLIIIDFSTHERGMLHLARVWSRQNNLKPCPIIGVCDYDKSAALIPKAVMTTIPCIHVKSSEFESIVYSMNVLAFPEKVQDHGFATAQMEDSIYAYHPAKVCMINEDNILIESNFGMQESQTIKLNSHWERNRIIRSKYVKCINQTQENLYYNYTFSQKLELLHSDPIEKTSEMTEEEFNELKAKQDEIVTESRYKMKKWLKENVMNSAPKLLKSYIIDKVGVFYADKPITDTYSFVFRTQPFILNAKKELVNTKPQLIIFNMENVDEEELKENSEISFYYNEGRMLQHLIKNVQEVLKDDPPIIIVFNAGEYDTAHMQKVFQYNNLLAIKDPINVELSIKMSEMLKTKIEPKLPKPNKDDVYIDKSSDYSYCEIESDITLLACSENDVYFNSDQDLKHGTIMRINLPVPMYITVCKAPEAPKLESKYYAVVNGIGEEERKELRRYVNSIFFRDLDLEKAKDAEDVEALKEKYLKQKEEEANAAKIEEEKRKKEEAEAKAEQEKITNQAEQLVNQLDSAEKKS